MNHKPAVGAGNALVSSDFVASTIANLFYSIGSQTLVATLPVYVMFIGGSQADAGLVAGTMAFVALLVRPLVGWLTDNWRRRPLVLVGTSFYGLASMVYLLAPSVPFLLIGRVIHGLGLSCYSTAANAYIADIVPARRRAEGIGYFSAAQSLGLVLGPAAGFLVIGAFGFPQMFYMVAGLALLATTASLFARERRRPGPHQRTPWTLRNGIVAVESLPITWTALCLGLGFGPVSAYIAIFAQSRGVENPGLFFTAQAIALVISRPLAGYLADRRGRVFVVVPGVVLMALALVVLPLASGLPVLLLSAILFGFGFGAAQPATMALLVDGVRPERRGLAISTYFTGFDLGISMGSIGLGAISEVIGLETLWIVCAACTLFGLLGLVSGRRAAVPVAEKS